MQAPENIYRLQTMLPGNGAGKMNAYLFKTEEGCLLVDTGWNDRNSYNALVSQLKAAGASLADVRFILITHTHPDHYGMVHRLVSQISAEVVIHEQEQAILQMRADNYEKMSEEMAAWLEAHDMPDDLRRPYKQSSLATLGLVPAPLPFRTVRGGEHLSIGDYEFEILWTPGHSPGHICLYEAERKLLVAGDHILPDTTSNVSMYLETMPNPLDQYLKALDAMRGLEVKKALPSHGEMFDHISDRIDAIQQHHKNRLAEMKMIITGGEQTTRQVAEAARWVEGRVTWGELNTFAKQMALTETIAHLELLYDRGEAVRTFRDGRYRYMLA